jgi:hypothetical protein
MKIECVATNGFAVQFVRGGVTRNYSPSPASFNRYVVTLMAMGWREKICGWGVSLWLPA